MLDDLSTILQIVSRARNLDTGLKLAARKICSAMEVDVCCIYLLDNLRDRCVLKASHGLDLDAGEIIQIPVGEGLVGKIATNGDLLKFDDISEQTYALLMPGLSEDRFKAFMGVPIIHRRNKLGVLIVQQRRERHFGSEEEAFLRAITAQIAANVAHDAITAEMAEETDQIPDGAIYRGISGGSGIGIGQVVATTVDVDLITVPKRQCADPEAEISLFNRCLKEVRKEIRLLRRSIQDNLPKSEQALFSAYLRILHKDGLGSEITQLIQNGSWAEGAVSQVVLEHARNFEKHGDDYLRERASDIRDLGRRLLRRLRRMQRPPREFPDRIVLIAEDLTPAALSEVPTKQLVGLISVRGSNSSHVAVLARALGVPTVMGARDLPIANAEGKQVIVDAHRGMVYFSPGDTLLKRYRELVEQEQAADKVLLELRDVPCRLTDGHAVQLFVNTGLAADIDRSLESGAEGVGLFRTEMPFMLSKDFPNEKEQLQIYRSHLQAFAPRIVTMRTLDIGGDKNLPYFKIEEENPYLGWRGIRICLDRPDIFVRQIRAMLLASEDFNNLRLLLPMLSNLEELALALNMIYTTHDDLLAEGHEILMPQIGALLEVPAAVYQSRDYARHMDFISVGSNDLTQYMLAVDRNNPQVADRYQPLHPAVLKALQIMVDNTHAEGKKISLCGDMAGDPAAAVLLVAMGYDTLSMGAANLLRIKAVLRHFSLSELKSVLEKTMKMEVSSEIRDYMIETLNGSGLSKLLGPHYQTI